MCTDIMLNTMNQVYELLVYLDKKGNGYYANQHRKQIYNYKYAKPYNCDKYNERNYMA